MTASQIGTAHSKMSTNVSGTEVLRMKSIRLRYDSSIAVFDLESDEFQIPLFAGDSNDIDKEAIQEEEGESNVHLIYLN